MHGRLPGPQVPIPPPLARPVCPSVTFLGQKSLPMLLPMVGTPYRQQTLAMTFSHYSHLSSSVTEGVLHTKLWEHSTEPREDPVLPPQSLPLGGTQQTNRPQLNLSNQDECWRERQASGRVGGGEGLPP
jgi:hypothetical protein